MPYKGAAPAVVAALAGEVQLALVGAPPTIPHLRSGKLQALAITQSQRSPLLPDVPTLNEAVGVMGDSNYVTWYGLLAPAKTPQEIVHILEKEMTSVLSSPAMRDTLIKMGTDLVAMPSKQFSERIASESAQFTAVIKKFGIKAG